MIVREWGGDIAFFSEPFRGSTFLVYLPFHASPAQAALPPVVEPGVEPLEPGVEPVEEPPVPAAPEEILHETILLVEDEPGIRALMRKILRRENYNVLEAGSAEDAMTMVAATPGRIDLLLTDVMLPGASGRELAEYIRETRQDLKVLYISGYTDDDAVRTGRDPSRVEVPAKAVHSRGAGRESERSSGDGIAAGATPVSGHVRCSYARAVNRGAEAHAALLAERRLKIAIVAALFAGLALSPRLWLSERVYPTAPVLPCCARFRRRSIIFFTRRSWPCWPPSRQWRGLPG